MTSSSIHCLQSIPSSSLSSPLLSQCYLFLSLLFIVRTLQQEIFSKTQMLSSSFFLQQQASILVFAPLWLFPASVKLSHVTIKRMKDQQEERITLPVLYNNQTDLSHLSLDSSSLQQFQSLWKYLYKHEYSPQGIQEADHRLVVVFGGMYSKGSILQVLLEIIRYVKGSAIELSNVMKNVYLYWNCEKEKRSGYLPYYHFFHEWNPSFLSTQVLQSDSQYHRYTECAIKDEQGNSIRYVLQNNTRVYQLKKGQEIVVVYQIGHELQQRENKHVV